MSTYLKSIIVIVISISVLVSSLSAPQTVRALDANKYAYEKEVVNVNLQTVPDDLESKLSSEVDKILSSSDRLQPYFQDYGITGGWLFWGYPGEEFLTLSEAMPYLDAAKKQQVSTYLTTQIKKYPPQSTAFWPYAFGSDTSLTAGQRREWYSLQSAKFNIWPPVDVPLSSTYIIWKYGEATGDWQYAVDNWTAINNKFVNYRNANTTITTYEQLLGVIGYVKLATQLNKVKGSGYLTEVPSAITLITNSSSKLSNLKDMIQTSTTKFYIPGPSHDWSVPLFASSRGNRAMVNVFGPELGRYIQNETGTEGKTIFDALYTYIPQWFLYKSLYPRVGDADATGTRIVNGQNFAWLLGSGYSEDNQLQPDIVWTFFMIKAYVYNLKGAQLSAFVDTAYTARGDLYYMQKLTTAIKGYGQRCWVDIRTQSSQCDNTPTPTSGPNPTNTTVPTVTNTGVPSATPTMPCKCDFDGDKFVDLTDYSIFVSNFLKNPIPNPKTDINGNGTVDLADYSLFVGNFLKTCN